MVMSLEKYVLLRAEVLKIHRTAARAPLIAACLQDRPVHLAIPGEGAKWLFFSDGAGHTVCMYGLILNKEQRRPFVLTQSVRFPAYYTTS